MKSRILGALTVVTAASWLASDASADKKPRLLNRSIYVPIEFSLCEHLQNAVLYQDGQPVAAMPVKRIFQFTYYPDLERLLPEVVQVRVEGTYVDGGDPFIAKLAVTADGIHTAHRTTALDTGEKLLKQRHKIDFHLEPRALHLQCDRFCARAATIASAKTQ